MPIVGRTDQKNCGISASTPRANTAETSGRNAAPPFPATSAKKDFEILVRFLSACGRGFIFQTATNTQSPNPYRLGFFLPAPLSAIRVRS